MKYVGLLVSSVVVFLVILTNFYYNSITLDMQKIKDYIVESNIILEDIVKKEEQVMEKKDEYITRLINLKKGIKNSKTSFLVKDYKEYKIKSIEGLIKSISEFSPLFATPYTISNCHACNPLYILCISGALSYVTIQGHFSPTTKS